VKVDSVQIANKANVSLGAAACIAKALQYATFAPPGGGGSTLTVDVELKPLP
jgi:hypothetical protein